MARYNPGILAATPQKPTTAATARERRPHPRRAAQRGQEGEGFVSREEQASEVHRLQQAVHAAILAGRLEEARATLAELIARQQATADTALVQTAPEAITDLSGSKTGEAAERTLPSNPWITVRKPSGLVLLGVVVGLLVIGRFWQRLHVGARRSRTCRRLS